MQPGHPAPSHSSDPQQFHPVEHTQDRTPMQAKVLAHRLVQVVPTPVFHLKSAAKMGPFQKDTTSHVSLGWTRTNLLQLVIMPDWIGSGVGTPLADLGTSIQ